MKEKKNYHICCCHLLFEVNACNNLCWHNVHKEISSSFALSKNLPDKTPSTLSLYIYQGRAYIKAKMPFLEVFPYLSFHTGCAVVFGLCK